MLWITIAAFVLMFCHFELRHRQISKQLEEAKAQENEDFSNAVLALNELNEWKAALVEDRETEFDSKLVKGLENLLNYTGGVDDG